MINTKNYPTRENILTRISELEIFNKYLGTSLNENSYFKNPLRDDANPTCTFKRGRDGRLRMKDYAGYFYGDCIDLVMHVNRIGYTDALCLIWKDFNAQTITRIENFKEVLKLQNFHVKNKSVFHVKIKSWNRYSLEYWKKYYITEKVLIKFNVYPIDILWIGKDLFDQNIVYKWDLFDPGFGYYFGNGEWKIYFPKRTSNRFLSNTNVTQGLVQLEKSESIVITKSLKDVMCLSLFNISAIAPQSESVVIKDVSDIVEYYYNTYVFFDNDMPGIRGAIKYKKKGAIPLLIPKEERILNGIKDISDYISHYGIKATKKLINGITSNERVENKYSP